jgi:hypothetical protein
VRATFWATLLAASRGWPEAYTDPSRPVAQHRMSIRCAALPLSGAGRVYL